MRAEIDGGAVTFAADEPAVGIVGAAEVDGGWVFVADDGLVAASDRFLGPLRAVGRVPLRAPLTRGAEEWTRGRAVFLRGGALWTCDGHEVARVDDLRSPVIGAAFRDALVGGAVLDDGSLVATLDGSTWREIDLHGELALEIAFDGEALRVATTAGPATLAPDAGLAIGGPGVPAPRGERPASVRAVTSAAAHRAAAQGGSGVVFRNGARAVLRDETVTWLDPSGAVGRRIDMGHCALERWGDAAALRCDGRLYRIAEDGRFSVVFGPERAADFLDDRDIAFSDDGQHAAFFCRPDEAATLRAAVDAGVGAAPAAGSGSTLCMLEDGQRTWRAVAPAAPIDGTWIPVGMHGSTLLASDQYFTRAVVLDTITGAAALVSLMQGAADASTQATFPSLDSLAWAGDGSLAGVALTCDADRACRPWLVSGAADAPLARRELPVAVRRVGFADARRGLAVGRNLGEVWRTLDGGRSWEPVPVGAAERAVPGRSSALVGQHPRCDETGCQVDGWLRIDGWGPMALAGPRRLAATGPIPSEPPSMTPASRGEGVEYGPLQCTSGGSAVPSPWRLAPGSDVRRRLSLEGLWTRRDRPDGRTVLAWRTAAGIGRAVLPPPTLGEFAGLWGDLNHALVFDRTRGRARLLWASGAATVALTDLPFAATASRLRDVATYAGVWLVTPAGDGGVVVQAATLLGSRNVAVMARVDPGGRVLARRVFVSSVGEERSQAFATARIDGRWGRVVARGAQPAMFHPLDGTTSSTLPSWSGHVDVCQGPPASDAVTLMARGCVERLPCAGMGGSSAQRLEVELGQDGACLRSVTSLEENAPESERDAVVQLRATPTGTLEGFRDDGVTRVAHRCATHG
ncbi:MAG: hypothetical protein Q8S73_44920 [Deltaproteobacteria bacterium]|nr:hypothetical protein [Myxococcales bacterium]MDP3221310.1 hypothetical protein [Deltaproteobacteria bacterium]